MDLLELSAEVARIEEQIEMMKHDLLRKNGWTYTCDTPGALWLWTKEIAGKHYAVDQVTALHIVRNT